MQDPKPMLTLKEWCDRVGTTPTHPTTEKGAVSVASWEDNIAHGLLWHLTDYRVDRVNGSVVWLLPKLPEDLHVPAEFCQNLDGMDPDDLQAYAAGLARSIGVMRDLFDYAMNKAQAMRFRERGHTDSALVLEKQCELIYKRLPIDARW